MKDITLPARYVDEKRRVWKPFAMRFHGPDGTFEFYIHAVSHLHAQTLLDDIKATAVVSGEVVEVE